MSFWPDDGHQAGLELPAVEPPSQPVAAINGQGLYWVRTLTDKKETEYTPVAHMKSERCALCNGRPNT